MWGNRFFVFTFSNIIFITKKNFEFNLSLSVTVFIKYKPSSWKLHATWPLAAIFSASKADFCKRSCNGLLVETNRNKKLLSQRFNLLFKSSTGADWLNFIDVIRSLSKLDKNNMVKTWKCKKLKIIWIWNGLNCSPNS